MQPVKYDYLSFLLFILLVVISLFAPLSGNGQEGATDQAAGTETLSKETNMPLESASIVIPSN